jgi:UrcA family protein
MNRLTKVSSTVLMFAAFACGFGVEVAKAGAGDESPLSVLVNYRDLNLADTTGVQTLYRRLRHASQRVCAPLESRELARRHAYDTCVATALANAVATIANVRLTAYYRRSTPRQPS